MDDFETNFGSEENKTGDTLEISSGQHGQIFLYVYKTCLNELQNFSVATPVQNIFNRGKKPKKISI